MSKPFDDTPEPDSFAAGLERKEREDTASHEATQYSEREECAFCRDHKNDSMIPPHHASRHCESGGHNHCTCDICY